MTAALRIPGILLIGALLSFDSSIYALTPLNAESVLASNSQVKITYEDLIAEMERLPEEHRVEFLLSEQRVAKVVENLIVAKIMAAEAQRSGLQNKANAAAEIRNQTEKILAKYRREELETNAPKIDLLPLAREIYLTRLKDYERPALYTSWHTLIKLKDRTHEAAMERAKVVKAKADAGEKLDAIAKEYSNDESASDNGGFIQPTPLAVLDIRFANALEQMKIGESRIVESEYGIHVVRLLKMDPRVRPSFENMKVYLLAEADKTYKERVVQNYLDKLKSDTTLKYNQEVLEQVRPKLPEIPPPPERTAPTRKF